MAKEGNEEVPAPTACVGDACGATSCARRVFNHIMLWSASGRYKSVNRSLAEFCLSAVSNRSCQLRAIKGRVRDP